MSFDKDRSHEDMLKSDSFMYVLIIFSLRIDLKFCVIAFYTSTKS